MSKPYKSRTTTPILKPAGRPGALTEQINFRISKATAKRLGAYQRENGIETRADAIRCVLREVGL